MSLTSAASGENYRNWWPHPVMTAFTDYSIDLMETALPGRLSHYGGYYTMTRENWPLIGPMATKGAFVAGALSGYGTMGACATGALCAAWILGETLPDFARSLSLARYGDKALMQDLLAATNTGVL